MRIPRQHQFVEKYGQKCAKLWITMCIVLIKDTNFDKIKTKIFPRSAGDINYSYIRQGFYEIQAIINILLLSNNMLFMKHDIYLF